MFGFFRRKNQDQKAAEAAAEFAAAAERTEAEQQALAEARQAVANGTATLVQQALVLQADEAAQQAAAAAPAATPATTPATEAAAAPGPGTPAPTDMSPAEAAAATSTAAAESTTAAESATGAASPAAAISTTATASPAPAAPADDEADRRAMVVQAALQVERDLAAQAEANRQADAAAHARHAARADEAAAVAAREAQARQSAAEALRAREAADAERRAAETAAQQAAAELQARETAAERAAEAHTPAEHTATTQAASPTAPAPAPQMAPAIPAAVTQAPAAQTPAAGPTAYGDSEIVPPTQALPEAVRPARAGWFERLRGGLARTRSQLGSIFSRSKIDESLYEDLETALLASDTGYGTTEWLLGQLRERVKRDRIQDAATLKTALIDILTDLLAPLEKPIDVDRASPLVMMIAGVNGAGKTTSIGKLARHLHQIEQSVLLAAGDTFRAAAREQLARWGERNQVHVIANEGGDPAAVAFDAIKAGQSRGIDVVMVDTAGRLPTQRHLMDELKKIRRVMGKAMDDAPHEVLLVLDGNTGQNMLAQVQAFDEAVQLTGLIVTKLDGTAKGGAIAALAHTRRDNPLPVYFIGVGEGVEDLQGFSAREFATALLV
jgi:signal recognition particle-docking protein ftsY